MSEQKHSPLDKLITAPQYILPHLLLSRGMYHLTRLSLGGMTEKMIRAFIKVYKVDMEQAQESDPAAYETFNDFFTRELKPEVRPIAEQGVVSPVDGTISQIGDIDDDLIFQAKGHHYSLESLFGGFTQLAHLFRGGRFCTLYLAPSDYHRIHMPVSGKPRNMMYVPGRLFSVNPRTVRAVPNLFSRNERVAAVFKSEAGPMAMVMVGALFVGSIRTDWDGTITPAESRKAQRWQPPDNIRDYQRGEEMGRFNMGSTVILLFDADKVAWRDDLQPGTQVRMGEQIGVRLDSQGGS